VLVAQRIRLRVSATALSTRARRSVPARTLSSAMERVQNQKTLTDRAGSEVVVWRLLWRLAWCSY
jgi:hypothetical protein